jgi:hypothetical protein
MRVIGVWMLQKRLYEGTETCKRGLYVSLLHFTNMGRKKVTIAWTYL